MDKGERMEGRIGSSSYSIGKLYVYERKSYHPPHVLTTDPSGELARYERAKQEAIDSLSIAYEKTNESAGAQNAEIFKAHILLLKDEEYNARVIKNILTDLKNAEWAVSEAGRYFYEIFASIEDENVSAKAMDIKDVTNKLIRLLTGTDSTPELKEPVILASAYLTPSELVQIKREYLKGIVMLEGSLYSHVVILAKTVGIPIVLGVYMPESLHGHEAIIDGVNGQVFTDPDDELRDKYERLIDEEARADIELQKFIGMDTVTSYGKKVSLLANIAGLDDAEYALECDSDGIGLTRTEFMFLDRDTLPTEEEHFEAYREIVDVCADKSVVFRTLDLGADKGAALLNLKQEENPALGKRAIRICLSNKEVFIPQIKGILRAAAYGDVSILYPMITSCGEMLRINHMVEKAMAELDREEVPYGEVRQGIMIETPAAALISDELAGMVDFFSIGTNDLTQFTLAIDRQNRELAPFYNPMHEAVMRLIQLTVDNAHKEGIPVTVCGELAADPDAIKRLLDMGVDALSVAPKNLLKIRKVICEL
ncbi:MAG: phosphoenolpyruvate--protein phosphotransferase [Lachnospiraceae bacterium]|nr:phosphoenolpyruvate--protein phosphotransferase [Lachnospiraceae bacterium]